MPLNALPVFNYASAAPTDSGNLNSQAKVLINDSPVAGEALGWICTEEGRPGSWAIIGYVESASFYALAAAGAIPAGVTKANITNTAAGTYTLAAASSYAFGSVVTVFNQGAAASTLAVPSGTTLLGGAVTATTAWSFMKVMSDGANNWIKQ